MIEYMNGSGKLGSQQSEPVEQKPSSPVNPEDLTYWHNIDNDGDKDPFKVPEGRGDEDFGKKEFSLFKLEEKKKMDLLLTYQQLKQDGIIDDICKMHTGYTRAKTPKKTKRDIYKEMSKAVVWTAEDVEKLRQNHKK